MRGLVNNCLSVGAVVVGLLLALTFSAKEVVGAMSDSASSLTTSPVSLDLSAKPGQAVTTELQVMNNKAKPETVSVHLEEFKAAGISGEANIYKPAPGDASKDWVHFSENSFTADPGAWNKITMTITLPPTATLGYYYAVLFTPNTTTVPQPNTVKGSNAILVLVNTNSGSESKRLQINSFTSLKSVYQFLPATFNVLVRNSGNIHLIPQGDIFISRTPNGHPIDSLPLNNGEGNVLPDSSRQFQVQWKNGLASYGPKVVAGKVATDSKGEPVQELQWNTSKSLSSLRFGKYYAHLVLGYNNGITDVPLNAYVSFWVVPWELLLLIALVIVLVVALFVSAFWRLDKKLIKKIKARKLLE